MKKKTVEKSVSSASFFWMSAVPRPLSTNTCKSEVNTVTSATVPYTAGSSTRARIIDTMKVTPCAPQRSAKRHMKFEKTFLFIFYPCAAFPVSRFPCRALSYKGSTVPGNTA